MRQSDAPCSGSNSHRKREAGLQSIDFNYPYTGLDTPPLENREYPKVCAGARSQEQFSSQWTRDVLGGSLSGTGGRVRTRRAHKLSLAWATESLDVTPESDDFGRMSSDSTYQVLRIDSPALFGNE